MNWLVVFFLLAFLGLVIGLECPKNCLKCDSRAICICGATQYGRCVKCLPGFYGSYCETPCPPRRFGFDCLGHCSHCNANGTSEQICTTDTGICDCLPEYTGKDCGVLMFREPRLKEIIGQEWGGDILFP